MNSKLKITKEKELHRKSHIVVTQNRIDPFVTIGTTIAENSQFWKWGDDNMLPYALSLLSRRSTIHRRIINDKADYISGRGMVYDKSVKGLSDIIETVNGSGETMRQLINHLAFDKCLLGNAFLEVVTDEKHSFIALFHQDATRCRISKDKQHIILHHNWANYVPSQARKLAIYPRFEKAKDGTFRSIVHYKDYEPMFENYGIPQYIAGMNVSAIAYKTDRWNISRLDNSFQLSGIMMLDAEVDNDRDAEDLIRNAESKFAGSPGQVMFLVKGMGDKENSKFIPITSSNEGDWKDLHAQATSDIVIAHSWFRSLSGLDYTTGFSAERILNEYEVALNTVIMGEQAELIEPIKALIENIMGINSSSIEIVNRPPAKSTPPYMKIWEARKADGLEYDPQDATQQQFIANITK